MPFSLAFAIIAAVMLGVFAPISRANAAAHDGNWSVLVITEKGNCDRGYRYSVNVANGQVRYSGSAAVGINGTVTPQGTVKVSIGANGQGVATGSGRLSAVNGNGTWRSVSNGSQCSGRWEAERR
jgi:phage tail sheath gpL-like